MDREPLASAPVRLSVTADDFDTLIETAINRDAEPQIWMAHQDALNGLLGLSAGHEFDVPYRSGGSLSDIEAAADALAARYDHLFHTVRSEHVGDARTMPGIRGCDDVQRILWERTDMLAVAIETGSLVRGTKIMFERIVMNALKMNSISVLDELRSISRAAAKLACLELMMNTLRIRMAPTCSGGSQALDLELYQKFGQVTQGLLQRKFKQSDPDWEPGDVSPSPTPY